ncbi:MAG TPA: hypothetical protein VH370_25120 [Humisphaera sp.]|nr:hypothetical protein [Humisphaera sp.]
MAVHSINLLLPSLICAATGGVRAWVGLRGRRIDLHPVCKRCRYDLIGSPTNVVVCSECGAKLDRHGAIQKGNRRRRPAGIVLGLLLLFVSSGIGCHGLVKWAATVDWYTHKPGSWVVSDISDPDRRSRAVSELYERSDHGQLSRTDANHAVERLLKLCDGPAVRWEEDWGDFICAVDEAGQLDAANWKRFVQFTLKSVTSLKVPPKVHRGELGVVKLHSDRCRAFRMCILDCGCSYEILLDGHPLNVTHDAKDAMEGKIFVKVDPTQFGYENDLLLLSTTAPPVNHLPDGVHRLRVILHVTAQKAFGYTNYSDPVFDLILEAPFELSSDQDKTEYDKRGVKGEKK